MFFFVTRPLRGVGGKGLATKKKKLFEKNVATKLEGGGVEGVNP